MGNANYVKVLGVVALLASGVVAQQPPNDYGRSCREHPSLSGPCFTVRGRMNFYNGSHSVRIWRVGTSRVLGVSEQRFYAEGYNTLPPSVLKRLSWNSDLFADFVVCPFTREAPGIMQFVCVDSATRIAVRPRQVARRRVVYVGPTSLGEWTTVDDGCPGKWRYGHGVLHTTSSCWISPPIRLPNRASVEFELAWKDEVDFVVSLYDRLPGDFGVPADPAVRCRKQPEALRHTCQRDRRMGLARIGKSRGLGRSEYYLFALSFHGVDLQRVSGPTNHSLGQVDTEVLFVRDNPLLSPEENASHRAGRVRVKILADKGLRSFWLFIDGSLVKQWSDPVKFTGQGSRITFQPLGDFQDVQLREVRVARWDGRL